MKKLLAILPLALATAALAVPRGVERKAVRICQEHRAKAAIADWAKGPCISNGGDIDGYVIDVAHAPRRPADDDPKNQCAAWRQGKVKHFVELDESCKVIRSK